MDYTIYAALAEDADEGWIWIKQPDYPTRTPVKVYNPGTRRVVFCESRHIDSNFVRDYNGHPHTIKITDPSKALVISEWYRDALGSFVTTFHSGQDVRLTITPLRFWGWRAVRAACHHPDIVARVGTRLGVLGAWLGLVGVAAPVLDFLDLKKCTKLTVFMPIAILAAVVGWLACRRAER